MSKVAIIAALSSCIVCGGVGYIYGMHIGRVKCELEQAKIDDAIEATAQKSRDAAAEAISQIKIVNRTINQKVLHEITEKAVYSDPNCRVPASGVQSANQAITGQFASGGELPKASTDSTGQ